MDYNVLKSAIASVIKQNGNREITGDLLQATLLTMVDSLGSERLFAGVVSGATVPQNTDSKIFYLAGEGTYPNFNGFVVGKGQIAVFFNSQGGWYKQTISVASAGYTLYDTTVHAYGSLPSVPTDGGLYYIYVDRVASYIKYRYIYTSNPSNNAGAWTHFCTVARWRLAAGESSNQGSTPIAPTENKVTDMITAALEQLLYVDGWDTQSSITWAEVQSIIGQDYDDDATFEEIARTGLWSGELPVLVNGETEIYASLTARRYHDADHWALVFGCSTGLLLNAQCSIRKTDQNEYDLEIS